MISVGIDPGTASYDIVAIEDGEIVHSSSIPSGKVRRDPDVIVRTLEKIGADVGAGLSGYGLPVKPFSEIDDVDVFFMTLNPEMNSTMGLRMVIDAVRDSSTPFYTIPGVIHLPTVPVWRKMNRIDMGTADKVSSTFYAVSMLQESIEMEKMNFVLAEIGYGFTAFISVRRGRIVDGIGGSSGFPGYTSIGALDAELAYLIGSFPKSLIFSGGVKNFCEEWDLTNEFEILSEFVLKGIRAAEVSVERAEFCVLCGRYARRVERRVEEEYETVILEPTSSAVGAAMIANGIAGGDFKDLLEYMRIGEAKGTVFDYLTSEVFNLLHQSVRGGQNPESSESAKQNR